MHKLMLRVEPLLINLDLENDSYKSQRRAEYPDLVSQLDDIYHNGIDGWKTTIKAIKDKYPKPS